MNAFFRRMREPSSSAGLAAVAQVAALVAPQWGAVFHALSVLLGALAVALPERGAAA